MKNRVLLKTNLQISVVLVIGFLLTALFGYQANYQSSLNNIEQISSLTIEDIYYQLTAMFTKPVNVSLTMAHDNLLVEHLSNEEQFFEDKNYIQVTKDYLEAYKQKYDFDSVFLVSAKTNRYYNFNGLDRVLTEDDPENEWFFELLNNNQEYSLNIDNDEVYGADNVITVFVNCKIVNEKKEILGVVGVGVRIEDIKKLLMSYLDNYKVETYLVNETGMIQISTSYTGYEKKDWFAVYEQEELRDQILSWKESSHNLDTWTESSKNVNQKNYVVARYIPELSWHLIAQQNTGRLIVEIRNKLLLTSLLVIMVIVIVLVVITKTIVRFNNQVTKLIEEKQIFFRRATEQLYDNIYEINITKNSYVGERTKQYFESLGAKGIPFDQVLHVIAEKQIKKEYQKGYISMFHPKNIIEAYEQGKEHLRYDFMITEDGSTYSWIRIDAYIFFSSEDNSICMFTYRQNIDEEKKRQEQIDTDEMTGFYSKKATERMIDKMMQQNPEKAFAFFMFDIDNFKQANDSFGHAFGDYCIKKFTTIIKQYFRPNDILGRIGGDEFVAFIPIPDYQWVKKKAEELSKALDTTCEYNMDSWKISASIGIAITSTKETDFETVYQEADLALYQTKENGKNGFTIHFPDMD